MKKILHIIVGLLVIGSTSLNGQNLTQATIQKTGQLVVTIYAKPTTTVNTGTNLNILFAVSLPETSTATATAASLIGGATPTQATTEVLNGRKCFPFAMDVASSTAALTAGVDNPIATVTFSSMASGEFVQLNDMTATSGVINVYWYIAYTGIDGTDYENKFYGTGAVNGPDSYVETLAPLPVTLVEFAADKFEEKSAILSWTTVSEENSREFVIQRSTNGINWSAIGSVPAAGFSSVIKNYSFIDKDVYNGSDARLRVYYRLSLVDRDNSSSHSPIQDIVFGNNTLAGREFSIYPNPATEGVYVEWDANQVDQPTAIEFFDVSGKLILAVPVADQSNQQYVDFKPSQVQSGLYLMRIMHNDEAIEHKQVVVGRAN